VPWPHTTRITRFILILALAASAAFSHSNPSSTEQTTEPPASEKPDTATDDATLNLHRWGAVTLFHGLPSDRVKALAEDASGALWFGTDGGLVRYDGRRTQVMASEGSLPSRRIRALKLDAEGGLWVGTDAGAARMTGERVEVMEETRGQAVSGIDASPHGEIAMVTARGEIIRYHRATENSNTPVGAKPAGKFVALKIDGQSQPLLSYATRAGEAQAVELTSIAFTTAGEWWIGALRRGALMHRDHEVREAPLHPLRPYFVAAVYAEGGRVWLGEQAGKRGEGLWLHDGNSTSRLPINTGEVTAIHGGGGEVWVGTSTQGAFLLKDGKLVEHLTFENTAGGLRSNHINAVFRDREGVVWFGTDRGVCRYDRDSFRVAVLSQNPQSNFVHVMLDAASGETWCGTHHGLFRRGPEADLNQWTEVTEIGTRSVYALAEDGAGTLWVGTSSGLFTKSKDAHTFTLFAAEQGASDTITGETAANAAANETPTPPIPNPSPTIRNQERESVRALAMFRGQMYVAVFGRGIERIEQGQRKLVASEAAAQRAICLAAEGEAALWLGTSEGEVLRFDGSQVSSLKLDAGWGAEHAVRAINASGGRVWLGTANGLYTWDESKLQEILPDVDVWSLLAVREAAEREVIWCGTHNAGLIKLLAKERVSIRFDTEQGLASQQVFALAAGGSARRGRVWIGTNRGIALHQPSQVEPRIEVRRLVANQIYLPDSLTDELLLPYTQKNFLLEVAALGSRTFPSQFQYEFTLSDGDRRTLKHVRAHDGQFAFEGLAPGAYTILARAISRDLIYSAPLTVRLQIPRAPFPWPTLLLASLLAVAVVAATWAYRQQRRTARTNCELEETNEELRETRIRLAKETESERSRIARDLHDQTLADLRHLLVLTDQLNTPTPDGVTPVTLRREIEAISSEIRHICEDLSPSVLENIGFLPALEWALTDAVAHLPPPEKFAYEFICEPGLEDQLELSPIEQIQLYRLVQEAINNVCRHAQANYVSLSVHAEAQTLMIEVKDDGKGFDGSPRAAKKTGHGMANIRSRANLIGAQVAWRTAARGCSFEVRQAGVVKSKAEHELRNGE
jgi:signal transduction histidine kinase/ligand-binding sensor domain-containing protein